MKLSDEQIIELIRVTEHASSWFALEIHPEWYPNEKEHRPGEVGCSNYDGHRANFKRRYSEAIQRDFYGP